MALRLPISGPHMNFDEDEPTAGFEFVVRVFVYISVLAVFVMVVILMLKLIGIFDDDAVVVPGGENYTETSRLLPKEEAPIIYGAFEEEEDDGDEESGKCSRSSSSEDIYDGKICVICYEHRRCSFFVPCGHCATCYQCAKRISKGEAKVCPFCRAGIRNVRRLLIP